MMMLLFLLPQALSKNGKVYGNGIMIGVQPCIDKVCKSPSLLELTSVSLTFWAYHIATVHTSG